MQIISLLLEYLPKLLEFIKDSYPVLFIRSFFNPYIKLIGYKFINSNSTIFYGPLTIEKRTFTIEIPQKNSYGGMIQDSGSPIYDAFATASPHQYVLPSGIFAGVNPIIKNFKGEEIAGPNRIIGENEAEVISYIHILISKLSHILPAIRRGNQKLDDQSSYISFAIGSSGSNAVTEQVLEQNNITTKFSKGREKIIVGESEFTIDQKENRDTAILLKTNNNYSLEQDHPYPVFIIAGLGENGTQGAGKYLLTHAREIVNKFGSNNFAFVLSINYLNISDVKILSETGNYTRTYIIKQKLKSFNRYIAGVRKKHGTKN